MYVGLKQPRGDGERYVTPARAAAKETNKRYPIEIRLSHLHQTWSFPPKRCAALLTT